LDVTQQAGFRRGKEITAGHSLGISKLAVVFLHFTLLVINITFFITSLQRTRITHDSTRRSISNARERTSEATASNRENLGSSSPKPRLRFFFFSFELPLSC
jgi:hypothetical protein